MNPWLSPQEKVAEIILCTSSEVVWETAMEAARDILALPDLPEPGE